MGNNTEPVNCRYPTNLLNLVDNYAAEYSMDRSHCLRFIASSFFINGKKDIVIASGITPALVFLYPFLLLVFGLGFSNSFMIISGVALFIGLIGIYLKFIKDPSLAGPMFSF